MSSRQPVIGNYTQSPLDFDCNKTPNLNHTDSNFKTCTIEDLSSKVQSALSLSPIFTSKESLIRSLVQEEALPKIAMNLDMVVQSKFQKFDFSKRNWLIVHRIALEDSIGICLENASVINAIYIAGFANKVLIHSDDNVFKILDLDNLRYSLLGADLCSDSQVLVNDSASIIVASLKGKRFRVWNATGPKNTYKGINVFLSIEDLDNLNFTSDQTHLLFTYRKNGKAYLGIYNLFSENPLNDFKSMYLGPSSICFFQASKNSSKIIVTQENNESNLIDFEKLEKIPLVLDFGQKTFSPSLLFAIDSNEIYSVKLNQVYPIEVPEFAKNLPFKGSGFPLDSDLFFQIWGKFLINFDLNNGKALSVFDLKFEADSFALTRSADLLAGVHDDSKISVWCIN